MCAAGPLFAPEALARDIFRGILLSLLLLLLRCVYSYHATREAKQACRERAVNAEETFKDLSEESTATNERLAKWAGPAARPRSKHPAQRPPYSTHRDADHDLPHAPLPIR